MIGGDDTDGETTFAANAGAEIEDISKTDIARDTIFFDNIIKASFNLSSTHKDKLRRLFVT